MLYVPKRSRATLVTIDRPETWKEKNRRAASNVMGHFLMRAGDNSSRHSSSSAPTRRLRETVRGVSSNFKLCFAASVHLFGSPFVSSLKQGLDVVSEWFFWKIELFRSDKKWIFSFTNSENDWYIEYLRLLKKRNLIKMFLFTKERERERESKDHQKFKFTFLWSKVRRISSSMKEQNHAFRKKFCKKSSHVLHCFLFKYSL